MWVVGWVGGAAARAPHRLQVAVRDVQRVHVGHHRDDLPEEVRRHALGQHALTGHAVEELAALALRAGGGSVVW